MNKIKGYYIHFEGRQSIGVSKKIDMQIEEFNKWFDMQEIEIKAVPRNLLKRIIGLFPTMSIAREYEKALQQIEQPDFIYVRRTVADHDYLKFFRKVKEMYPKCKIIIEIFTYPYDKDDFGKWNAWPFYIKERIYRKRLKNYIDRFVTYSDDKGIFGVPTICTTNGVDAGKVKKVSGDFEPDKITMMGVAYMQRQHGFERIIEGMREYYNCKENTPKVFLRLVGDGPEKKYYENMVERYQLDKYISFYPTTTGEELDRLYDESDIALAAFGFYKVGFYKGNSSLKACESLVKGLPVATGCSIAGIDENCPFVFLFPNNNSTVKIKEIIAAFQKLQKKYDYDKEKLTNSIRNFSVEKVGIDIAMQPIIDYVRG